MGVSGFNLVYQHFGRLLNSVTDLAMLKDPDAGVGGSQVDTNGSFLGHGAAAAVEEHSRGKLSFRNAGEK